MFDKIQLELGIHVIEKLIKVHDQMRKNSLTMAQQDCQFVIDRLCDDYLSLNHGNKN